MTNLLYQRYKMDKNILKNKFDDFISGGDVHQPQYTPSARVLEAVMAHRHKRKRKFFLVWFLFGLIAFFTAGTYFVKSDSANNKKYLSEAFEPQSMDFKSYIQDSNALQEETVSGNNMVSFAESNLGDDASRYNLELKNAKILSENPEKTESSLTLDSKVVQYSNGRQQPIESTDFDFQSFPEEEKNPIPSSMPIESNEVDESDERNYSINSLLGDRIELLPTLINPVYNSVDLNALFTLAKSEESKIANDRVSHLNLFAGTSLIKDYAHGFAPGSNGAMLIGSHRYNHSFGFNVGLEYHKEGKFSIGTGLGFRRMSLHTHYILNIPYDLSTEVAYSDHHENSFSHTLPSDMGDIESTLVVFRAIGSEVHHNENVNVYMNTLYCQDMITIPLIFKFHTKNIHQGLYFQAHIQAEHIIHRQINPYSTVMNHDKLHHRDIQARPVGKNNTNIGFGGAIGYRLSLGKDVVLDPGINYNVFNRNSNLYNQLSFQLMAVYRI
jgi:hypothetical protein